MNKNSVLDSFKLYYEDLEKKVKKTSKTDALKHTEPVKPSIKDKILVKTKHLKAHFNNVVNKVKIPRKKGKKLTKAQQIAAKEQRKSGIMGIGLLLVVVSIAYSTSVIFIGADSFASKLSLIPQALFAAITLFKAFSKIYE